MPIKQEFIQDAIPPFANLKSFLVTMTILECIDKDMVFEILRQLSHQTRAYLVKNYEILRKRLHFSAFTNYKRFSKRSSLRILSYYGRPNEVLQLM